jgi:hypothetical protein
MTRVGVACSGEGAAEAGEGAVRCVRSNHPHLRLQVNGVASAVVAAAAAAAAADVAAVGGQGRSGADVAADADACGGALESVWRKG